MPRPGANYWQDGVSPFLWPGLNDREAAILDYAEELGRATVLSVGSSRNLLSTDIRQVLEVSAAATITIPFNLSWADGEWCEIVRVGTGAVTIAAAGSVTLESAGAEGMVTGSRILRVQMSSGIIRKRGTNLYLAVGDFS